MCESINAQWATNISILSCISQFLPISIHNVTIHMYISSHTYPYVHTILDLITCLVFSLAFAVSFLFALSVSLIAPYTAEIEYWNIVEL